MSDDITIAQMRAKPDNPRRDFMSPGELINLRREVIKVQQDKLARELISPVTGHPLNPSLISYWESGKRPIPLWAARMIRSFAEAAKIYDAKATQE
jgi:predicted transcriptional regulator